MVTDSGAAARLAARRELRQEAAARRSRRRRRLVLLLIVLVLLSPALYSYTSTMLQPSSLPLGVRSVEWLRDHHGNWLVDEAEQHLLQLEGAEEGRPAAEEPAHGRRCRRRDRLDHVDRDRRTHALPGRRGSSRSSRTRCRGEGVWKPTGPPVDGRPPVLVTTFRTELDYPRIVAYVAWFDHTRTALALLPGPLRAAARARSRADVGSLRPALAAARDLQRRLHLHRRPQRLGGQRPHERAAQGRPRHAHRLPRRPRRHHDLERRPERGPDVAFARQSLPPIIWNGRLNPAAERQLAVGLHAGERRPRLAHRRRHRPAWQPDLRRRERPDRDHARADPPARGRGAGDAVRHQPRVADPDHLQPPRTASVPTKVVPNVMQPPTRYLVPDDRDFFAVYRRLPGPVTVPFK